MRNYFTKYFNRTWGSFLALGIFGLLFGIVCLLLPWATALSIVMIAGVLLLIAGIASIINAINDKLDSKNTAITGLGVFWTIKLVISIIIALLGLYFVLNPNSALSILALIIGLIILVRGIFDLSAYSSARENDNLQAYHAINKGERTAWMACGILGIIVGAFFVLFPWIAGGLTASVLCIVVGVYSLIWSINSIIYAIQLRKSLK
ncbi:MAG: DUF308 domain-containing protein [Candidatus Ancillula sp.]|jgi:uncharacterized membrane protein HdeD (DUF308 family)|nr:DUF308 domain-containing protein [Candidatus Ancillula sp.]